MNVGNGPRLTLTQGCKREITAMRESAGQNPHQTFATAPSLIKETRTNLHIFRTYATAVEP